MKQTPEEIALELIQENLETKDTKLDLTILGLTAFPIEILDCIHLDFLDICDNKLTSLPDLAPLVNLIKIYIDSNLLKTIEGLSNLKTLEILMAWENPLIDISPIAKLPRLKELYIGGVENLNIIPLKKIKSLDILDIQAIDLYNLSFIEDWFNQGKNLYYTKTPIDHHKKNGLYLHNNPLPEALIHAIHSKDRNQIAAYFKADRERREEAYRQTLGTTAMLNEELPALTAFDLPPLPYSLKYLAVKDFQCIQSVVLDNLPTDAQFIVFTGENGDGKTSVLQAIAMGLYATDNLTDKDRGNAGTVIYTQYQGEEFSYHNELYNNAGNPFLYGLRKRMIPVRAFAAYGASRLTISEKHEPQDPLLNLFGHQSKLIDITATLLRDLAVNDAARFEIICQILIDLLPNVTAIRKRDPHKIVSDLVFIEKGKQVDIEHLSAGHKSILLMIGDMLIRLSEAQPSVIHPKDYSGIVLIDEIEAHLHPIWQKEFPTLLARLFPKVQFIITTHSAITLLGLPRNTVVVKVSRDEKSGTTLERLDIDLENLLPNHILSSPIFGMNSIFNVENKGIEHIRTEDDYPTIAEREKVNEELRTLLNLHTKKGGKP